MSVQAPKRHSITAPRKPLTAKQGKDKRQKDLRSSQISFYALTTIAFGFLAVFAGGMGDLGSIANVAFPMLGTHAVDYISTSDFDILPDLSIRKKKKKGEIPPK